MKLALHFPNFTMPGAPETLRGLLGDTARAADEGGFAAMTVMDHWFQMEPYRRRRASRCSRATRRSASSPRRPSGSRSGLLVTGVTYRYPGLLAKTVTTLDVLSGGRALLGIGAAWYEQEHDALGVPFPPLASGSSG